jgi:CheY-like chemotaxis protein
MSTALQAQPPRVLMVNDSPYTGHMIAAPLTASGAQVRTTSSVNEALLSVKEWRPNVLVSDSDLPVKNGYDLIRDLRALGPDQGGRTPAIALTANAGPDERMKLLAAGYQMQITKPVDPAELSQAIANLANRMPGPTTG